MRLPRDTHIATTKVKSYLLQWRPTDDKSAFLSRAGYAPEKAHKLIADIQKQVLPLEAEMIEQTEYGKKYRICGALTGPNGKVLRVVTVWMTEEATGKTKFITLCPDKT